MFCGCAPQRALLAAAAAAASRSSGLMPAALAAALLSCQAWLSLWIKLTDLGTCPC